MAGRWRYGTTKPASSLTNSGAPPAPSKQRMGSPMAAASSITSGNGSSRESTTNVFIAKKASSGLSTVPVRCSWAASPHRAKSCCSMPATGPSRSPPTHIQWTGDGVGRHATSAASGASRSTPLRQSHGPRCADDEGMLWDPVPRACVPFGCRRMRVRKLDRFMHCDNPVGRYADQIRETARDGVRSRDEQVGVIARLSQGLSRHPVGHPVVELMNMADHRNAERREAGKDFAVRDGVRIDQTRHRAP